MTQSVNPLHGPTSAPDIGKLVREEVHHQLGAQRQVLYDAVGFATKIVGVALALLVGIFTVFGLTTWRDIKASTGDLVRKQAEALLTRADSETGVKATLTNLMNQAVVASALAKYARGEQDQIALSHADWTRLRAWITDENLELQDLADALLVLNLQDDHRKAIIADRVLSKMLETNPRGQFAWIQDQPDKVETILSVFKHKNLASRAIAILSAGQCSEETKLEAAKYPREVGFKEGTDKLLGVHDSLPQGELKQAILESCLSLRPDHPGVLKAVTAMLEERSQPDGLVNVLGVLRSLWPADSSANGTLDLTKIHALGPRLVAYLFENGAHLELRYPSRIEMVRSQFESNAEALIPHVFVWTPAFQGVSKGHPLSFEEFAALDPLWEMAGQSANRGRLDQLARFLPAIQGGQPHMLAAPVNIGYSVSGDEDATIEVERSSEQMTLRVGDLRSLHISAIRKADSLQVTWIDSAGATQTGVLKNIKGTTLELQPERLP